MCNLNRCVCLSCKIFVDLFSVIELNSYIFCYRNKIMEPPIVVALSEFKKFKEKNPQKICKNQNIHSMMNAKTAVEPQNEIKKKIINIHATTHSYIHNFRYLKNIQSSSALLFLIYNTNHKHTQSKTTTTTTNPPNHNKSGKRKNKKKPKNKM